MLLSEFLDARADKIKQLNKKGIETIEDLVRFMPRRYYDFRFLKTADEVKEPEVCCMKIIVDYKTIGMIRSGGEYLKVRGHDTKNNLIQIMYYHMTYMDKMISIGESYLICGKCEPFFNGTSKGVTFANPVRTTKSAIEVQKIIPVYSKIQGMSDAFFEKCMDKALSLYRPIEYLENSVIEKFKLWRIEQAIYAIHRPTSPEDIKNGKRRLLFDDLFLFNYMLQRKEAQMSKTSEYRFTRFKLYNSYISSLPFTYTDGQKEAVRTLVNTAKQGKKINAVVQGDVGCGKTEVAKSMLILAYEMGYQSVLLAPTNVLAKQHYNDCVESFKGLDIEPLLLTGEMSASKKKKAIKQIKDGTAKVIVGTHALLADGIEFKDLAMVIVDEEHKFGVKQREKLTTLTSMAGVHSISMSATLIPRTMALSLYGNADIISIKTLPNGKKPIITELVNTDIDGAKKLKVEIAKGHQAYIVCPLIDESENMANVESVAKVANTMKALIPFANIDYINGSMKEDLINEKIAKFKNKEIDVLVSTTIIEVGVNVPNATIIWIKSAERFGLAQLHQLRGRVGRGTAQGVCLLQPSTGMSNGKNDLSNIRVMCETNDGFEITKRDLELRGSGNLMGTEQSGNNKYVELMLSFPKMNEAIRKEVEEIFKDDARRDFYEERLYKEIDENKY